MEISDRNCIPGRRLTLLLLATLGLLLLPGSFVVARPWSLVPVPNVADINASSYLFCKHSGSLIGPVRGHPQICIKLQFFVVCPRSGSGFRPAREGGGENEKTWFHIKSSFLYFDN